LKSSASLEHLEKPAKLSTAEIENFDGIVLDVRQNTDFGAGHVPNAINIGLGGQFASWAGMLITIGTPVAIAADTREQVDEAFMRMARVGIETVKGFVLMKDFTGEKKMVEQVPVEKAKDATAAENVQFVDVRNPAEHANGHAAGTINLPLNTLSRELDHLNPELPTYVLCQGGYRSSLGTSILENAGFKEIYKSRAAQKPGWTPD
jgi:rhodanese-related sulfurtransferase